MAGGIGSRFWPLSKIKKPKQFLDILGTGRTLLQQTFDRFRQLMPADHVFIVSNLEYKELILEQLPELPEVNILLEPLRRNTAPCIGLGAIYAAHLGYKGSIAFLPADHFIRETGRDLPFRACRDYESNQKKC